MQKFSLIDYPGKISCILFTQGCYFRCPFCHNPSLVLPEKFENPLCEEEILNFLEKRNKQLDAVVISGGEPTMHKDLPIFIEMIKKMGYLIKLDTSGINPKSLAYLLDSSLIDYVAMDIKAPLEKYKDLTNTFVDVSAIKKSIEILFASSIAFEFRSTLVPNLHTLEDVKKMSQLIKNTPLYILQKFLPNNTLDPKLLEERSFADDEMEAFQKAATPYVKRCQVR